MQSTELTQAKARIVSFVIEQLESEPINSHTLAGYCKEKFKNEFIGDSKDYLRIFEEMVAGNTIVEVRYVLPSMKNRYASVFFSNDCKIRIANYLGV